jgi:hypothetical protein
MLFDFECSDCSKVFEELVESKITVLPCVACKGNSTRLIAAPRIDWRRMGLDPAFPSCYERWGDAQEVHKKTDKGTMHGGKAPNLLMY